MKIVIDIDEKKWESVKNGTWCGSAEILNGTPLEQEPTDEMVHAIAKERYEDLCEYFGGAKDILKSREDFKAWLDRVRWHIRKAEELKRKIDCTDDENYLTNQQWLTTIPPEEWLKVIDWLYHEYGKGFTDSETAIKEWLNSDKDRLMEVENEDCD